MCLAFKSLKNTIRGSKSTNETAKSPFHWLGFKILKYDDEIYIVYNLKQIKQDSKKPNAII